VYAFVLMLLYVRYCSDKVYAFVLTFVVMRDIVQRLSVRFSVNVCFYGDIFKRLSVRFCAAVCFYARYCSVT
jgi:hypothetical protein